MWPKDRVLARAPQPGTDSFRSASSKTPHNWLREVQISPVAGNVTSNAVSRPKFVWAEQPGDLIRVHLDIQPTGPLAIRIQRRHFVALVSHQCYVQFVSS